MDKINNVTSEAVTKATGKSWDEWIKFLDKHKSAQKSHKEIARWLKSNGHIESDWWCQMVTVGYEKAKGLRVLGEVADASFQVGVQKTLDASKERIWEFLTSPEGVKIWLGRVEALQWQKGAVFQTGAGIKIEIRSIYPREKIRLSLQSLEGTEQSILQLYLLGSNSKTSLRFHQEKLKNRKEREKMKRHWQKVLELIRQKLG